MYDNIKSCIMHNNCKSDLFPCMQGVRQAKTYPIFVFYFPKRFRRLFWRTKRLTSWYYHRKDTKHTSYLYSNCCFTICWWHVIFSESLEGMQKNLDTFQEYCNLWKLSVNSSNTKVIVLVKEKVDKIILSNYMTQN